jgi:CelD/BcsL family acetyltransferase involved in cellulose biosynthesis
MSPDRVAYNSRIGVDSSAVQQPMTMQTDHYEIIDEIPRFYEIREEWNALAKRVENSYFSQSFEWCRVGWEEVAAPRKHRLHCIVGWRDGRAFLIWPFVLWRSGLWALAHPLGSETTEYTCPLVVDDDAGERRIAAALKVLRQSCGSDLVFLPHVRADSPLHPVLSRMRLAVTSGTAPVSAVTWDTHRDWASYRASLDATFRRKLERTRRRLAERGELIFEPAAANSERAEVIDWVLNQKRDWLVRKKRTNPWLLTQEYRDFLAAISCRPGETGRFAISTLRLNGDLIAAALMRLDDVRAELLIPVYDPAYSKYGPGQLLMEECLRWACSRNLIYDLRIGAESYKKEWSNWSSEAFSYEIANTIWGAIYLARTPRVLVPRPLRRLIKAAINRGATAWRLSSRQRM